MEKEKEILTLGDEMKSFENKFRYYTSNTQDNVYVLRCDGVSFSKFCKDFDKPFDKVFRDTMIDTMSELCSKIQGAFLGYTQSDEITILFNANSCNEVYYAGNIQKIASIAASQATNSFNKALICHAANNELYVNKVFDGFFDGRVYEIPRNIAYKTIVWRMSDCYRNAVQMIARSYFSHKELYKKTTEQIVEMLINQKGIDIFIEYSKNNLYGTISYKKEIVLHEGKDTECIRKKWFLSNAKEFDMKSYFETI